MFVDAQVDRLIITLKCSSPQILDELWKDYRTGHLNKIAQTFLVSDELLKTFGVIELKLKTTIVVKESKACQQHLLRCPGLYDRVTCRMQLLIDNENAESI